MFEISVKMPKSTTIKKKSSKFVSLCRSIFHPKPKLSVVGLEPVSKESSTLPSLNDNLVMPRQSVHAFFCLFEKVATKISVGLGIFGGFYAFHQIFLLSIDQQAEDLEMFECIKIVY